MKNGQRRLDPKDVKSTGKRLFVEDTNPTLKLRDELCPTGRSELKRTGQNWTERGPGVRKTRGRSRLETRIGGRGPYEREKGRERNSSTAVGKKL